MLVTTQSHIRKDLGHVRDLLKPATREIALIAVGCVIFAYGMKTVLKPAR